MSLYHYVSICALLDDFMWKFHIFSKTFAIFKDLISGIDAK